MTPHSQENLLKSQPDVPLKRYPFEGGKGGVLNWLIVIIFLSLTINLNSFAQETEANEQFLYAQKLMEDGLLDLAISQFEDFLRIYPDSPKAPEAQFMMGVLLRQQGEFEKSSSVFRLLMVKYSAFPKCDEALFKIAQNHIQLNEIKKGIDIFERLSLFYPKSGFAPMAYLEAGLLWNKQKDLVRAEESWLRILQEYPQSNIVQTARYNLSNLYFQKRDFVSAQAQIDHILDMNPDNDTMIKVSILKAKILTEEYQLEQAEQLYKQALKIKSSQENQVRAKIAYTYFLNQNNRFEDAKHEIEPLRSNQLSSSLKDSVILVYVENEFDLGNDQIVLEMVNTYQHSMQDSTHLATLTEYGINSALRSSNHTFAIDLLKKRLSFEKLDRSDKPLIKKYHLALIDQFVEQNLYADALQHGQTILNWDWNDLAFDSQVKYKLAQIYQKKLDQPRQALFYYEQILAPKNKSKLADEAAYEMAVCYEKLNDDNQAVRIFRNFSNTFPGSPLLEDVDKKLEWYKTYKPENVAKAYSQSSVLITSLLLEGNSEKAIFALIKQMFEKQKDYSGVIQLGKLVGSKNVLTSYEDQFYQIMGESYYRLALSDRDQKTRSENLDKARTYLLQYIAAVTDGSEQLRIALMVHDIDSRKSQLSTSDFLADYDFLSKLIARFPNEEGVRYPKLELAKLLHNYGLRVSRDSILSALTHYTSILNNSSVSTEIESSASLSFGNFGTTIEEQALFYRSEAYFAIGDTTNALNDLENYRNQYPRGHFIVSVLSKQGSVFFKRQNWPAAELIYSDFGPKFYYSPVVDSAQIRLAQVKIKLEKYNDAISILNLYPENEEAVYLSGFCYQKMEQEVKARKIYYDYLDRFPEGKFVSYIYFNLSALAKKNQQLQEEAFYNEQFLKRFPNDPRAVHVQISQADQLFKMGKYSDALAQYSKLLIKFPDEQIIHKKRIIANIRLGKISASRRAIDKYKKQFKDPKEDLAELEYEIGNYMLEQKSFKNAEKQFEQTKSRYKRTVYAVYAEYGLGKLKIITNHIEDGLKILTKIPSENENHPVLPELYLTLGDFYYKTKQFGQAIAAFNTILELNPSESIENVVRKYQIKSYTDVGQYDLALIAIRRFLEKFPNDDDAFVYKINMGVVLINLKEYDRAIKYLQALLPKANNEHEAEIRYHIAQSYHEWGQYTKAIAEYLKVTYLTKPTKLPWHVTAEYQVGLAYMKLQKWDRAKVMFNNIVKKEGAVSDFGRAALMKVKEVEQLQQN